MPNYRRPRISGACWFFTVTLADRRRDDLVRHVDALRDTVRAVRDRHPFRIDAFVVLPDHVHAVWTLPEDDDGISARWYLIKLGFTRRLVAAGVEVPAGRRPGERGLWQRRFWDHRIRDDADFARHVDYCHVNPLKHGLVSRVADWPYSSFHRTVRDGVLDPQWAGDAAADRLERE